MSVLVTLQPTAVEVDPGTTSELVVRVRNTGQIVDRFTLEVLGDAAPWANVTPSVLSLFPGAEDAARIEFAPPAGSSPHAGRMVFGLRVRSSESPATSVVEEGSVTVRPYTAATAILVPQTSRGSRSARHDVTVVNGGNVPVEVAVQPSDPDRLLSFDARPPRLSLQPGETGTARVTVHPNDTFLNGTPQSHPFIVGIASSGQAPFELRGTLLQRAILPSWTLRAVGIAALASVLAVGAFVFGGIGQQPKATPGPSVAVASPTPEPTEAPTPTPPPSAALTEAPPSTAPTPSATPSPTPVPTFDLDHATTQFEADNFQFVCNDDACRGDVIAGLRNLATTLLLPYAGGGQLFTPASFSAQTMPLIIEASGPFPWKSQDGAGTTQRFVVDFAPFAQGVGSAYAVFEDDSGTPRRYDLPPGVAAAVLDRAYDSTVMVLPSYNPVDWGLLKDQVLLIPDLVVASPAP